MEQKDDLWVKVPLPCQKWAAPDVDDIASRVYKKLSQLPWSLFQTGVYKPSGEDSPLTALQVRITDTLHIAPGEIGIQTLGK